MAGCTISPLAFIMAMEVIIQASKWVVLRASARWYNASLKDSDQCDQLREETIKGLVSIDKTLLPGKLKLLCLQFGLLPRLMWPLTVYEIPMTKVEKLERTVSSYIKKWLGLPRCLSNIGLYGHGALELPVSSLTEEYKCTKVRLNMILTESQDGMIQAAAPRLATGRKWMPSEAVQQAKSALRHGDIVGQVQHGRGGFGLGASRPTWHKATSTQRRKLVVSQVRHQEEADRCAKAVSQSKQGQWTSWENLEHQSSHGRIFGKWKEDKSASSSEPPMMFFPRPRTYTSGLEKILLVHFVRPLQH
ncbi:hypothetical protein AAFF_G00116340 [Aldrovandia affinis]|uniref:Uncharacterized protein n=1 Tax=Aldrovandia affinis TaxID=143900 RepID=A0AAD7T293_9TELE|nr:hypothetical protein AAFF_G00116340 [Aldrovandia affinis]